MDIEALTKLNELKEKGVLSQEEFEKQKAILLNDGIESQVSTKSKKGVNWKNVGKSFLISLLYSIIIGCIASSIDEELLTNFLKSVWFISAAFMSILAFSVKSGKYQNCSSAGAVFLAVFCLGPIGIWWSLYEYLQIKQGYAVLKK